MQQVLNNLSTGNVGKPGIISRLEQCQGDIPETIRLVAVIIQQSLAELVSPFLMVGLILSMSNFLLNGAIFAYSPIIPVVWVLIQCIAIDANLGVMLVLSIKNFQSDEWAKGVAYALISVALLFVAVVVLDVEAVQEVLNKSLDVIFGHLHVNVEVLTLVRSCAVVLLVATTQLKSVSLRRLKASVAPVASAPAQPEQSEQGVRLGDHHFSNEEEALRYLHNFAEQRAQQHHLGTDAITEELSIVNPHGTQREQRTIIVTDEQHEKLMKAWKVLSPQGHLSIRQLQRKAGVRREAAAHWYNNECWKDDLWLGEVPCTPEVTESEAIA